MRKTHALVQVAAALMAEPDEKHWGYSTSKKAGVRPGALYPILTRMLADGWLTDGWEDPTTVSGRPPRRYYQLSESGKADLRTLLDAASGDPRFAHLDLAKTANGSPLIHQELPENT